MSTHTLQRNQTHQTIPAKNVRNTFGGVVKSEWIKLMSLRSIRFTLIMTFAAGVGISLLGAIVMTQFPDEAGDGALVTYLLQVLQPPIMFLGLLFGVLGVFAISSEYSSGMILSTLSATPKRGRVFFAKLLVVLLISLGTIILTLGVGQGLAILLKPEAVAALADPQYLSAWGGAIIFLGTMTLLAFGVAGILRSTAGGIAVISALTFVLPIVFSFAVMANKAWIDWGMEHLPLMLGNTLSLGIVDIPAEFSGEVMSWGEAAISMGVWAAIFVIPAYLLMMKRDAK